MSDGPGRDELSALLDSVADAVLTLDHDWRVGYANRRARQWLTAGGPLQGRSLLEVVPELRDSAFHPVYERARTSGEPGRAQVFSPTHGVWLEAEAQPGADQVTVLVRDCTARRREEIAHELLGRVSRVAETSAGTIRALARAATVLREATGYEVAKVWLSDHLGTARLVSIDHDDDPGLAAFADMVREGRLATDAPTRRAMASGLPLTITDLPGELDAERAELARVAGLRAGIYLPLRWPDGITAAIGLLTRAGQGHDDWCAILADAHPRLAAFAQRERSRQELAQLFDLAREGLCITSVDGRFHRVNPELAHLLGRGEEELLARPYLDIAHPDDRPSVERAVAGLMAGEEPAPFELRALLPSGEERILAWTSRAEPDEGLIYSAARDVTAERRRERFEADQRALLRAVALDAPLEQTLQRLVEDAEAWLPGARATVWSVAPDADRLELLTAPSMPHAYLEAVGTVPIAPGAGAGGTAAATGRPAVVADIATDTRTATYRELAAAHGLPACWAVPFHGGDDEVLGTLTLYPDQAREPREAELATIQDAARLVGVAVSHHRSQAALTRSEERFRLLANAATDAMWDWDAVDDVLWVNEGFVEQFDYAPDQAGSPLQRWVRDIHPDDREEVRRSFEQALAGDDAVWEAEYRHRHGDGTDSVVSVRGTILRDERGRAVRVVGGIWDLTAQRERDEERERARRLQSLAMLASGMTHDLNNVLSPIILAAELLRTGDVDERTVELSERIERSARRGSQMVRQVLAFARGADGAREPVDAGALVDEIVQHARATAPPGLTVGAEVADGVPPVRGDATQLHQVLLNLVTNACDAMPDGGALTITADDLGTDGPRQRPRVLLTVSDTGAGIPEDLLTRIFEPFFTTKERAEGTGLGLATAWAIVESHGGRLDITSHPAGGTTATVDLPALPTG